LPGRPEYSPALLVPIRPCDRKVMATAAPLPYLVGPRCARPPFPLQCSQHFCDLGEKAKRVDA
jgi:hypothetical protein